MDGVNGHRHAVGYNIAEKIMKVLYISYDGMTDPLGQSQVLPYLLGLAAEGHSFTLLSCEKPGKYSNGRKVVDEMIGNAAITWQPIMYTKRPPVISTLYDYWKIKKLALMLHRRERFDAVHCRSYIPALVGDWMKRKFGTSFIFDMRGFWADERVDGGLWNMSNPLYKFIYRFFKKKEAAFLRNANHVISLTHKAKEEMLSWPALCLLPGNISVIPCCTDTALFDPLRIGETQKKECRAALGIKQDDFVLSYLGSIGTWYMLEEMLEYYLQVRAKYRHARFLFITHDEHARIRGAALAKGIPAGELVLQPAGRSEVPLLLSMSDAAVFFIRPSYSKMSSCPTKQGEIMSMGIPVTCNAGIGDTDAIVETYQAGIVMKDGNYETAVQQFAQSHWNRDAIRAGAIRCFSLQEGVAAYNKIYHSVS